MATSIDHVVGSIPEVQATAEQVRRLEQVTNTGGASVCLADRRALVAVLRELAWRRDRCALLDARCDALREILDSGGDVWVDGDR